MQPTASSNLCKDRQADSGQPIRVSQSESANPSQPIRAHPSQPANRSRPLSVGQPEPARRESELTRIRVRKPRDAAHARVTGGGP